MKKGVSLFLALSTIFLSACQQERISLNETTEEIESIIDVSEVETEDTEASETKTTSTPVKKTTISQEITTEILDFANKAFYYKFEYPKNMYNMEIIEAEEENFATKTFHVMQNDKQHLIINAYNENDLATAYNELEEFESHFETDNFSFSLNFTSEDVDFVRIAKKSFYAEDL